MLAVLLTIVATPIDSVRAEPVEAPPFLAKNDSSSTSSGRTEVGIQTALDAERAFAADAQTLGQWTAFRKWAASDATMFVPQPINAQTWLKDRQDPAKAIDWWPTASYVSCDGSLAVNTGGWKRADGAVGYFSTVWQRQQDGGWKWIVDGGDDLKVARTRPVRPMSTRATCSGGGRQKFFFVDGEDIGGGLSRDKTMKWGWEVLADGTRVMSVSVWTGRNYKEVINDRIAAPK